MGLLPKSKTISAKLRKVADTFDYVENVRDLRDGLSELTEMVKHLERNLSEQERMTNNYIKRDLDKVIGTNEKLAETVNELRIDVAQIKTFLSNNVTTENTHKPKTIERK